jgi:hypothetical protein
MHPAPRANSVHQCDLAGFAALALEARLQGVFHVAAPSDPTCLSRCSRRSCGVAPPQEP